MFPKKISKEEVLQLPLGAYYGEVVIIEKPVALKQALQLLNREKFLGFDTETRPSFASGEYHPVSLVQLSTVDKVYLIRLNYTGYIDELKRLFSNPRVKKVGVNIKDDLLLLRKVMHFKPAAFLDLNTIAHSEGFLSLGLRNLTATFLGLRISKTEQISNWDREKLSDNQVKYAATDAWACREIYQKLINWGYVEEEKQ